MRAAVPRLRAAVLDKSLSSYWPLRLDLSSLPPVLCSIGYGSGVFRQKGYTGPRPMVDVVLLIRDADVESWHGDNLKANPSHYAGLPRAFGGTFAAKLQRWGPGLYYNPNVRLPARGTDGGLEAKYGVMTVEALLEDLRSWRHLYMAGRMQKPCAVDWQPSADTLLQQSFEEALAANRRAALAAGVLSSEWGTAYGGRRMTELDLVGSVVRLSYEGDIRMAFAENPRKVANIVAAQEKDLWTIYKPLAADFGVLPSKDLAERRRLFLKLPREVREACVRRARSQKAAEECAWEDPIYIRGTLSERVRRASVQQTAKGAVTAGIVRGVRYAARKVKKRFG